MSAAIDYRKLIEEIGKSEGFEISKITPLSGGSINEVFLVSDSLQERVIKINKASRFPGMFEAEKKGLETLRSTDTFCVPEVYSQAVINGFSYLLMEFLPSGSQNSGFWNHFAENLASLHKTTAPEFGFSSDNYIGSLPQFNDARRTAADFYISQRLEPQLKLATNNGFRFQGLKVMLKKLGEAIPPEPPSLLHGDLWSGNYLVTQKGLSALIDPAICYGPREMDLAMMKLFGGFPQAVFDRYSELFPLSPGFSERVPLWQLYYLLVHLNIFGSSYLPSVNLIIEGFGR